MKLTDLHAWFIRYEARVETWTRALGDPLTWKDGDPTEEVTGPREYRVRVGTLAEAQGIYLECPICKDVDGHHLEVTFAGRGVADSHGCHGTDGKPTRWTVSGTGLNDLTTQPSIQLLGGCNWHGFITNGDAA